MSFQLQRRVHPARVSSLRRPLDGSRAPVMASGRSRSGDVAALQRAVGNGAVQRMLRVPARQMLQRDYDLVPGEEFSYRTPDDEERSEVATWAVSADLSVTVTIGGQRYKIVPSEVHGKDAALRAGEKGNKLFGGFTVLSRDHGTIKSSAIHFSHSYGPDIDGHSEEHFVDAILKTLAYLAHDPESLALILEIRQTFTPCAACQKKLTTVVRSLEAFYKKPVIVRASATSLYESQPGALGRGLHTLRARAAAAEHGGLPDMGDIHGIHQVLPAA